MTRRFFVLTLILLTTALESFTQVPWDFAYPDEKEDSISSLSIKPVPKPEKLLKQIIQRLELDLQQKHKARKYKVEATFWQEALVPFSFGCTLSAEAGVGLNKVELGELWYEGPYELNNKDTIQLRDFLYQFATLSPIHAHKTYSERSLAKSPLLKYKDAKNNYNVSAYTISDETGRGVHRFQFAWKKGHSMDFNWEFHTGEISGTAYFDGLTLRLTQFKGEAFLPSGYETRLRYQVDYYEKSGTPILKQIKIVGTKDDMIMQATVNPAL